MGTFASKRLFFSGLAICTMMLVRPRAEAQDTFPGYAAVERGNHYTVWAQVSLRTNLDGTIDVLTNRLVQVANGLNRLRASDSQWVPSAPELVVTKRERRWAGRRASCCLREQPAGGGTVSGAFSRRPMAEDAFHWPGLSQSGD
jgi:hypothetical protein